MSYVGIESETLVVKSIFIDSFPALKLQCVFKYETAFIIFYGQV